MTTQRLNGIAETNAPDSSLLRAAQRIAWLIFATAPGWTVLIGLSVR